jgi:autotransporter family porin
MFQQRRHDRGEPAFDHDGAGAWARVSRDQLHTTIAGQVDARSQANTLQIGSDVARWGQQGRGSVGIMLATGDADTQATSRITGYGTRGKVKGDAVGVYGSWVQNAEDSAGLYLDGWLQYGRYDSWVQGDALAREKYDATTRAASLEAGYAFALSNSERRAIYLQPQVQVSYTDYKGDTLQEVNGTIVEDDQAGGLETRVGVRLFGHDNAVGNRVQPFLAVNWLYNERGDSMRFDGQSLDAKLPTNRYEAQAGAQLRLGERWSAWGDLRVQRGDSGYKDAGAQLGVRRAW